MNRHTVTFRFTDGVSRSVTAAPGASVLEAGLEAQVPLLHQCGSGSCSTCLAHLVAGDARPRAGASSTLLASELAAGQRLLCVTEAQGDCCFELPYGSELGAQAPVHAHAFVNAIEPVADSVVKLSLELAEGDWLSFRPGQFLQVEVPGAGVWRSYSPVSSAADLPRIDLLIRLQAGGAMSAWLRDTARVDEVLSVHGPYGVFFLREKQRVPHIFIAGGTGLAPVLAMVDAMRAQGGRKPPMLLNFGCATPDQLFYLDELALRSQWLPTLETRVCVDRGGDARFFSGSPVAALRPDDVRDPATVAYLCGPQGMIAAATETLVRYGLDPHNIHSEQFLPSH